MTFALSTNWYGASDVSGTEIAAKARELGFDALELGFNTTEAQVREIAEAAILPVGSVHAFCPVPISAPRGYPELYRLASFSAEDRAIARLYVRRNLDFAASVGAKALVLHAGRIAAPNLFGRFSPRRRKRLGRKLADVFRRELDALQPDLERTGVRLGLENLPTPDGFPNAEEMREFSGDTFGPWLDTGHWFAMGGKAEELPENPIGMHVNDSAGGDDHLVPGRGKIDFAALAKLSRTARHLVLEPAFGTTEGDLKGGLEYIRRIWSDDGNSGNR